MAESLGRWRCWDDNRGFPTSRVAAGPPQSTEGEAHEHHVHIHIGDEALSRSGAPRVSRRDNAGDPGEEMPARRNGNPNGPSGAQPRMLARMLQDGRDGSWAATDAEGRPCEVRNGDDGALEIWHHPSVEQSGDEADPDVVGTHPIEVEGEAGLRAGPAHDRRAAFDQRALEQYQTHGNTEFGYAASRAFAVKMAEAFKPQRRS